MSLAGIIEETTDALRALQDEIPDLQVYGYWNEDPTPPCVDLFPPPVFQEGAGFLAGNNVVHLTVRARVALADAYSGQQLLLRLLDPDDAASVEVALASADWVVTDGVSGFTQYADDTSATVRMLGCEWRVTRFLER